MANKTCWKQRDHLQQYVDKRNLRERANPLRLFNSDATLRVAPCMGSHGTNILWRVGCTTGLHVLLPAVALLLTSYQHQLDLKPLDGYDQYSTHSTN